MSKRGCKVTDGQRIIPSGTEAKPVVLGIYTSLSHPPDAVNLRSRAPVSEHAAWPNPPLLVVWTDTLVSAARKQLLLTKPLSSESGFNSPKV